MKENTMRAVILAAGISTRLRPLTDNLPKPMLLVAGRPMLEHIIRHLTFYGVNDIIITTHYRAGCITNFFGNGEKFGAHIHYAHETVLMNTAGSLKSIENLLSDDFLVVGGNDLLPTLDIEDFYRFHVRNGGIGTIAFKHLDDPELLPLFGQGVLNSEDRLTAFEEKPKRFVSNLIHTTYQIYTPRALALIPEGIPCSIPEYLIHRILAADERIYGYRTKSDFICISTREQYERAQQQLKGIFTKP